MLADSFGSFGNMYISLKEYEADPEKFWAKLQNKWTPGFTYGIPGRVFKTREERDAYIESKRIPRD